MFVKKISKLIFFLGAICQIIYTDYIYENTRVFRTSTVLIKTSHLRLDLYLLLLVIQNIKNTISQARSSYRMGHLWPDDFEFDT